MIFYNDDFEATVPPEGATLADKHAGRLSTEVWLYQIRAEDGTVMDTGYTMDDYMGWVLDHPNTNHVFHNLEGYDGHFIISWLLAHGYHHYRPGKMLDAKHTMKMDWKRHKGGKYFEGDARCFTVFDGAGAVNFFDSLPLMNSSLRKIGEDLGMAGVGKGDETPLRVQGTALEDTPHRVNGETTGEMWTWDEALAYMDQDTLVLCEGAKHFDLYAALENGIQTQAKLAYETLYARLETTRPTTGEPVSNRANLRPDGRLDLPRQPTFRPAHKGYPVGASVDKHGRVTYKYRESIPMFTQARIPTPEGFHDFRHYQDTMMLVNNVVKGAYRGGFCWVNPEHQGVEVHGPGTVLDINSMYPSIYMACAIVRELSGRKIESYTEGRTMDVEELRELAESGYAVVQFDHLRARCKPGWPPTIKPRTDEKRTAKLVASIDSTRKVNETYDPVIDWPVTMTYVDLQYLCEAYEVEYAKVHRVLRFERSPELETMFREHGEHWMKVKETHDGYERTYAKIMVNAPYGKLGQFTREYPVYEYTSEDYENVVDQMVGGRKNAEVAAAAIITALGRKQLAETIHRVGMANFYYCDTDSIHIRGEWTAEQLAEVGVEVHPTKLGAWKIENYISGALYIQPKTYGEVIRVRTKSGEFTGEEVWKTTTAGLTRQVPRDQFHHGMQITDLRTVKVPGGVVLLETPMVIAADKFKGTDPDSLRERVRGTSAA